MPLPIFHGSISKANSRHLGAQRTDTRSRSRLYGGSLFFVDLLTLFVPLVLEHWIPLDLGLSVLLIIHAAAIL
jgi:hypothetical protein